jgi:hypothetical protein
MRVTQGVILFFALVSVAVAQSPEPPLSDTRLTVHTLLREDAFAGFLENDMVRFARAERNTELLLKDRPAERGNLLAWKGLTGMHRAVLAHEAGKADEFQRYFQAARDAFAEAGQLSSGNDGVAAITGGTLAVFADRLPQQHRAAAWSQAYAAYSNLWKEQAAIIEKLPVHHRGEVLSGLAQTAHRTGRTEESAQYVDKMLELLKGTPYEATAKQWKADPASAASSNLTCKNCHNPGRLTSRLAGLNQ